MTTLSNEVASTPHQRLYKLTDKNGFTRPGMYNQCLWGPNISHSGTGKGDLCGPGYIHAYTSPYLAVLLNPIHANMNPSRLWIAEGIVVKTDKGLKVGCKSLTTLREISLPEFTTNQKIYFALLCAAEVYKDSDFLAFVHNWVTGRDRSAETARAVAWAAEAALAAETARAVAWAAEAAETARAVAWAAEAALAGALGAAAARAAAAAEAARAAWAARAAEAAEISPGFNLDELAEKAYRFERI
jgi:hypothetical protein